ncbi:MAG: hypothetical protein WCJ30_28970 [Deltaproteobacteria bacterium]
MTDPARWRDGADDLPPDVRASLRAARRPVPPTAADRAAMVALATRIAAAPPVAPPVSPLHTLAKLGGAKGVGLAGLIAAAGVAVVPALRHPATPSATSVRARGSEPAGPVASASAPNATDTSSLVAPALPTEQRPTALPTPAIAVQPTDQAPTPVPETVRVARVVRAAANTPAVDTDHTASPACPVAQGAGESDILDAATRALGRDPSLTLLCLRSLETRGALGLRDEYWFLGFEASRRLGRQDDARRWGQSLLGAAADSPYAARVRRWIDGTSAP